MTDKELEVTNRQFHESVDEFKKEQLSILNEKKEMLRKGYQSSGMDLVFFEVPGAGEIYLSSEPTLITGVNIKGFSFGVSWGRYDFLGGVLDKAEAIKLAEFILSKCKDA